MNSSEYFHRTSAFPVVRFAFPLLSSRTAHVRSRAIGVSLFFPATRSLDFLLALPFHSEPKASPVAAGHQLFPFDRAISIERAPILLCYFGVACRLMRQPSVAFPPQSSFFCVVLGQRSPLRLLSASCFTSHESLFFLFHQDSHL